MYLTLLHFNVNIRILNNYTSLYIQTNKRFKFKLKCSSINMLYFLRGKQLCSKECQRRFYLKIHLI
jgi:hypothetical protein